MRPEAMRGDDSDGVASPRLQIYYDGTGIVIEYPLGETSGLSEGRSWSPAVQEEGVMNKIFAVAGLGLDLAMFGMLLCGGVLGTLGGVSHMTGVAESAVRNAVFLAAM